MSHQPFFSICIPAYKNIGHLQRLLESVWAQTFKDFEIVITDDTPNDSVQQWCMQHPKASGIRYFKNESALGTPENWNESIRQARGQWIKLMHNDDWLPSPEALEIFARHIHQHPHVSFFFSAFQNVHSSTGIAQVVRMNDIDTRRLKASELNLFHKVYVGNPSCTVVKRCLNLCYDARYKFVVDFEYYIRLIRHTRQWHYIDEVLLSIGFHDEQVTVYTKYNPAVQVPENHDLLREFGPDILKNVLVYDYYWRMYRNTGIRSVAQAAAYDHASIPDQLQRLIRFQAFIPFRLLKMGVFSKLLMAISYLVNRVVAKQ